MKSKILHRILSIGLLIAPVAVVSHGEATSGAPGYNRDIRPILSENCFACHGPDGNARKAELRLDDPAEAAAVLAGDGAAGSEVIRRILSEDPDERMPPPESNKSLTEEEKEIVRRWVASGAPYEQHWAFIPPQRPTPPPVYREGWNANPIDAFILRGMRGAGLQPSPPADRATLLRRVSLDLIGLPPTPEAVTLFEADTSEDAYEQVVEGLLASERYGEHMAQGWLEVARYADTDGYQNDRLRYMHVWRDWLIEALNENMPFDQFVIEQMAGDMLPDATLRQQIATGFNRNHRINSENGAIPAEWLVENVADRVDTLGTAFLGLTVSCARCHDHKYDPISQREYYQLFAQFNNVPEWGLGPNDGNSPPFIEVPKDWPNLVPEEDRKITPEPYTLREIKGTALRPEPGSPSTVMVMEEMAEPRPTYRLNRGVYNEPDTREVLKAAVPAVLLQAGERAPDNRLALARWLVSPTHPLTARVAVNRYWQHFFGRGLVRSSENFGLQGNYPSHPELLDWLATEFARLDWDVKAFQKSIVMSATYRQSSVLRPRSLERDPENRYLARAPRLRLSGQQLRDQALFLSELLMNQVGGRPVKPYMPPGLWESVSNATYAQGTGDELYRRSLYTYWRRTTPPPMMTGFNSPDRDVCMVRAAKTSSPLHALTLMNNVVFLESSRKLAERMLAESDDVEHQIVAGFHRVTARYPTREEGDHLLATLLDIRDGMDEEAARAFLQIGECPPETEADPVELASMALLASAILNLDEVIMRN